jgi:hypothetical protein
MLSHGFYPPLSGALKPQMYILRKIHAQFTAAQKESRRRAQNAGLLAAAAQDGKDGSGLKTVGGAASALVASGVTALQSLLTLFVASVVGPQREATADLVLSIFRELLSSLMGSSSASSAYLSLPAPAPAPSTAVVPASTAVASSDIKSSGAQLPTTTPALVQQPSTPASSSSSAASIPKEVTELYVVAQNKSGLRLPLHTLFLCDVAIGTCALCSL